MKRLASTLSVFAVVALWLALPAPADEGFGLKDLDIVFLGPDGSPSMQAGSHPYEMKAKIDVNTIIDSEKGELPIGAVRDLVTALAPGLVGDRNATTRCSTSEFTDIREGRSSCSDSSQIGQVALRIGYESPQSFAAAVYNLVPPPGVVVKFGFVALGTPVTLEGTVATAPPYNVVVSATKITQSIRFYGSTLTAWGVPASSAHDSERGDCAGPGNELCPVNLPERPLLTLPRSCAGPLLSRIEVDSWQEPGKWLAPYLLETHDNSVPPNPLGTTGCSRLDFAPRIESQATSRSTETGTGFDFNIDFSDEGLTDPEGIAQSDIKRVEVILPQGVTINPSVAEGLAVCTPAQLAGESATSAPGQGCPNASKIGAVYLETPLVEEAVEGSVFLAQQDDPSTPTPGAENPFDTLISFYIVLQNRNLGISVKLPAKVVPDPRTGQLVATVEDVPQLPFSHFNFHFREGQRAPLVTPPACGTYATRAVFTPWANPSVPLSTTASFEITSGVGGGPCPPGGVPPFKPAYEAGSLNNNAGSFSPFYMRLIRSDGEQDMTKFSSVLPPGVVGSLKGVSKCPASAIEAARAKTGREELASPSCPANSQIGRSLGGAGVGSALTYVGGQIYLGGPYRGDPLSVVSITPAVAGPFDAGTVVVRLALDLNPETAEVEVDGANSDPIPHILKGIPLKVRDLRVYVDRQNFTLNPTSCDPSSAKATLFGGFLDVFSPLDDVPVDLSTRYQAANCLNLGFKPNLKLNLRGGTKRGGHPGLKAILTPRPGDANLAAAQATLPRSAFLDQAHIRTICTRVQFAAEQCPPGSVYGFAKAWTPLLDEPFEGPVILRSSNNKLPDLVLALKGLVDVNVSSRIDSKNGGIRNTFEVVPDAPVSKFILTLQGGKKGLIVNSRDLCQGKTSRANIRLIAHNGRVANLRPKLQPQCGGKRKRR